MFKYQTKNNPRILGDERWAMFILNLAAARSSGTRNYSNGLIQALIKCPPKENLIIYLPSDLYENYNGQGGDTISFRTSMFFSNSLTRIIWEQVFIPIFIFKSNAKALFSSFDIAPMLAPCPVVLAVRNPSPLYMGRGWYSRSIWRRLRAILQRFVAYLSTQKATFVMYPSQYASDNLGCVMNVKKKKRRVVYHGLDQQFWGRKLSYICHSYSLSRYDLERDKYFLFVSMLYHYKKPDIAIRAFAMKGKEFKSMGIKLVIVGGVADPAFYLTLKNLIDELNMRGSVILAGYVPKEDLPYLYANCRAFLLPTVIETFGQPFVEAMATGSCVIAADLPFAREICADAALYFEKDNIIMLSDLMLEISGSNLLVNDRREKAADRVKFFSWEKEAIQTISLLRESVFFED